MRPLVTDRALGRTTSTEKIPSQNEHPEIGIAIQERRKQLGLDQAELARRAGVSRQWVIAIEQGKPGAALGLVMRALKSLDLPLWLGKLPVAASATSPAIDLDAVLERARGRRK